MPINKSIIMREIKFIGMTEHKDIEQKSTAMLCMGKFQ